MSKAGLGSLIKSVAEMILAQSPSAVVKIRFEFGTRMKYRKHDE